MNRKKLSHTDGRGRARMVDVSEKPDTVRTASAHARITMNRAAFEAVRKNRVQKGDVFAVSRLAGIMAAKRTHELIPLCHPLSLSHIGVEFVTDVKKRAIDIIATCSLMGKTGVEMEALTAASVAALTLYDMAKALDKGMVISDVYLLTKTGGRSGTYRRR